MAHRLVVADTDLVIDFLRGHGSGAGALRRWLADGRLRVTAVTAFELRVGTDFLSRLSTLGPLLATRTLPFDLQAGLLAGAVSAQLRATGLGIGLADTLQAGICKRHDLPLATRNRRHFERVQGLELATLDE